MLRTLTLENFKGFATTGTIRFKPITLIFGHNSAGKSSILQSLYLLKQTRENAVRSALVPRSINGYADLGSFEQLVHLHDIKRTLRIAATIDGMKILQKGKVKKTIVEGEYGFDVSIKEHKEHLKVKALSMFEFANDLHNTFRFPLSNEDKLQQELYIKSLDDISIEGKGMQGLGLKEFIKLLLQPDSDEQCSSFDYELDGFLISKVPETTGIIYKRVQDLLAKKTANRESIEKALRFLRTKPVEISNEIDKFLRNRLMPIGPMREPLGRFFLYSGSADGYVGYRGELLAHVLYSLSTKSMEDVHQINGMLEDLDVPYQVRISKNSMVSAVKLYHTKSKVEVSLQDVGFGISQFLPFLVQSVVSRNHSITIEQPELHVHPRLQADLADIFVRSIKPPYNNQFIIETHSEHLILRLLRRIRETTKKEQTDEGLTLSPDDISVLYVDSDENGSKVLHLNVESDGEFSQRWPNGFFMERTREMGWL